MVLFISAHERNHRGWVGLEAIGERVAYALVVDIDTAGTVGLGTANWWICDVAVSTRIGRPAVTDGAAALTRCAGCFVVEFKIGEAPARINEATTVGVVAVYGVERFQFFMDGVDVHHSF